LFGLLDGHIEWMHGGGIQPEWVQQRLNVIAVPALTVSNEELAPAEFRSRLQQQKLLVLLSEAINDATTKYPAVLHKNMTMAAEHKRDCAFHEAGHCVAAAHFELTWRSSIWRVHKKLRWGERFYSGITFRQTTTKFNEAVIGWAGPIAELQQDGELPYALDPELVKDELGGELSPSDAASINCHRQKQRTFETAANIIRDHRHDLEKIERRLLRQGHAESRAFFQHLWAK